MHLCVTKVGEAFSLGPIKSTNGVSSQAKNSTSRPPMHPGSPFDRRSLQNLHDQFCSNSDPVCSSGGTWRPMLLAYVRATSSLRVIRSDVRRWEEAPSVANFSVPPMLIRTVGYSNYIASFELEFTRFLWHEIV